MIVAIGMGGDPTLDHFARQAVEQGAEVQVLDLFEAARRGSWALDLPDGRAWLEWQGELLELDPRGAYYFRPIDLSLRLPGSLQHLFGGMLTALSAWLTTISGVVVNRPGHMQNNGSKPLHEAWLTGLGFTVPPSVTSSDSGVLSAFASDYPAVVKSVSGVRADSRLVEPAELRDLDRRQGPVHLQQYVEGFDVRAHVVGNAVVAQRISTPQVDYRTVRDDLAYGEWQLPSDLERSIVSATTAAGLLFAGWDFKVDEAGEHHCLEVNPMPGYDAYDRKAQGLITAKLVELLEAGT